MCGIAGLLEPGALRSRDALSETVVGMTARLRHRGPDDQGTWIDEARGIALGSRRLAIVDLSPAGHQPMPSASGRYVVVFNGEIYNFPELRGELEGLGAGFRGHSDTEVLLAAVEAWGLKGALARANGMFALALWDRSEHRLHLVRDRLGEKPLYYGWHRGAFLFASELKAFRSYPDFRTEIDRDALALYLRHNCVPAPHSIFRGIRKLPPATKLSVRDVGDETLEAYWSAKEVAERAAANRLDVGEEEAADELDRLLRESIRMRMIADVPLGALLSGGIDSSTVVALMQAQSPRPIRTFTIGSPDRSFDEGAEAAAVAQHLGTQHRTRRVSAEEARAVIPLLPEVYDEPFGDSSEIPTYLVSRLAREEVTVALSGDGGDELFGGYNRYSWGRSLSRFARRVPRWTREAIAGALTAVSPPAWDAVFESASSVLPARARFRFPGDRLHKLADGLSASRPEEIYTRFVSHWNDPKAVVVGSGEPATVVTDRSRWAQLPEFTEQMMYLDSVSYLPDDILVKLDRASMAVSLEARVPYLDHRLYEFAWRLPLSMKVRGRTGKWLLRRVLERYVPKKLVERPKMGFGIPIGAWLRGSLRDWAEDLLSEKRLAADGLFRPEPIRALWAQHLSARRNWEYPLWDVLMFQAWWRARPS